MSRKRKISLVLADVDGTLVTEEKVLTQRAQSAVRALRNAGIRFAITSGRPPLGMAMLFDALELDTPIAGFNGGLFVERDLTILAQKTVPADVARQALDLIREHGLDAWVYCGNDWLITKPGAPHVAREAWTVKFEPKVVPDFDDVSWIRSPRSSASATITTASGAARLMPRPRSGSERRQTGRSPTISTSPTRTRIRGRSWSISRSTWTCRSRRSPRSGTNRTTC